MSNHRLSSFILVLLLSLIGASTLAASASSTEATQPAIAGQTAKTVGDTTATIDSLITPNLDATTLRVHYATDAYYQANGDTYDQVSADQSLAGGAADAAYYVSATDLSGLSTDTLYHYSVEACNSIACSTAADSTFQTGPSSSTGPEQPQVFLSTASSSANSATITSWITPSGGATTYRIDSAEHSYFVATGSYTQSSSAQSLAAGANDGGIYEGQTVLSGLTPGVTYDYQTVACNSQGCIPGANEQITTPAIPPSVISPLSVVSGSVSANDAGVQLQYNPNNSDTTCSLRYVSDASYLPGAPDPYANAATSSCQGWPGGSGNSPVTASFWVVPQPAIPGLNSLTNYHVQVTLSNIAGSNSSETTLTTNWNRPAVSNFYVDSVGTDQVVLHATVNTQGVEAAYHASYTAQGASSATNTANAVLAGSFANQVVSIPLSGLQASTLYQVSIYADNSGQAAGAGYIPNHPEPGWAGGQDMASSVFTTAAPTAPQVEPQVSIIAGPPPETTAGNATFNFNKSASVTQLQCQVDADAWKACESGYTIPVLVGDHRLQVRGLTADGQQSAVAAYYWSRVSPPTCTLKTDRTRLFVYSKQNSVRLVHHYTAWKPAKNVTGKFYAVLPKGKTLYLGSAVANFKKRGVFRLQKSLPAKTMKQIRGANSYRSQILVPHTTATCTRLLTRNLTVKQSVAGQDVFFQSDSLFVAPSSARKG